MGTVGVILVIVGILAVTAVAVWLFQRSVANDPSFRSSGMGDGLGNVIDVFDPGQARANRDLKDQQNVGPVSKVPERDPDDPIAITLGPDGNPRSVRIRRPR